MKIISGSEAVDIAGLRLVDLFLLIILLFSNPDIHEMRIKSILVGEDLKKGKLSCDNFPLKS